MDLRKEAKSLQVFQIFKKEFNTAVPALGTHLSQKLRAHPHLHTEKVPFVLDHDNDFEFCWAFHPQGRPSPCRRGPGRSSLRHHSAVPALGRGEMVPGEGEYWERRCNSICRVKRYLKQYPSAWHLGITDTIHRTPSRNTERTEEVLTGATASHAPWALRGPLTALCAS